MHRPRFSFFVRASLSVDPHDHSGLQKFVFRGVR